MEIHWQVFFYILSDQKNSVNKNATYSGMGQNSFGSSNAFGGYGNSNGGFGNTTTGFGMSTPSGFGGSGNASSGFGGTGSSFGNTAGGFGNNNTGGGFGTNRTGGFGFGSNNNNSGGFGNNNNNSGGFGNKGGGFGFGNNNGSGGGFGNNNGGGFGFGSNNNNKSGFGFGNNNNNGGGFGNNNGGGFSFGNNNNNGGGFGFGNNNGGFGNNNGGGFGFGNNNKGGFGFGNNNNGGGFGFGNNNNNGGGFNFGNNNNGGGFSFGNNTSNSGLSAGGFNVLTEQVRAKPFGQFALSSFQLSQKEPDNKQNQPSYMDKPVTVPLYSQQKKTEVKPLEPQVIKEETKELMEDNSEERTERVCVVEYKKHFEVISCQYDLTIADLKVLIRKRITGCPNQFNLLYHSQVLLNDTVMLQNLRDGVLFTIIPDESTNKQSLATSIVHYVRHAPSLEDPSLHITPSLDKLSHLLNSELEAVPHFIVERKGVAKIEWLEPVDLRDLVIDQVVSIENDPNGMPSISVGLVSFFHMQVYGDLEETDPSYPPLGTGLNHPAILTFYNVKPPEGVSNFDLHVREVTEKLGATFVSYDEKSGEWVIQVPHFTRYGLWESKRDHEGEECVEKIRRKHQPEKQPEINTRAEDRHQILQCIEKCQHSRRSQENELALSCSRCARLTGPWILENDQIISFNQWVNRSSVCPSISSLEVIRDHVTICEESDVPGISFADPEAAVQAVIALTDTARQEQKEYEMVVWELIHVLFTPESESTRLRLLGRWIQMALKCPYFCHYQCHGEGEENVFSNVVLSLLHHDIHTACKTLQEAGYDRLSVQVAQINCSSDYQYVMSTQVQRWEGDGMFESISLSQQLLLWLLAGDLPHIMKWTLSWVEMLGVLLWYCGNEKQSIDSVLQLFLQSVTEFHVDVTPIYPNAPSTTMDLLVALIRLYVSSHSNQSEFTLADCVKTERISVIML